MVWKFFKAHWIFSLLAVLAFPWVVYCSIVVWSVTVGDASQHMQYAWLIPLLSGYLLWMRRKAVIAAVATPRPAVWSALCLLLLSFLFLFFGVRGQQPRFILMSLILILMLLPLAAYGWKTFWVVAFPLSLLVFLTPVEFLDDMTGPMRRLSASVTAVLLNGFGIESLCQGTAIIGLDGMGPPAFKLEVEDPCSGIRSIVALFVGTAAYGAYMLKGIKHRWLLFFSSFPIAFLGNVIRLFLTALVAAGWGQAMGMRLHDNALFIIAPVYIFCVFKLTDCLCKREERNAKAQPEASTSVQEEAVHEAKAITCLQWGLLGIIGLLLPCIWFWAMQTPQPVLEADTFIVQHLQPIEGAHCSRLSYCYQPTCLAVERYPDGMPAPTVCRVCQSTDVHPYSLAEYNILPKDTRVLRAIYDFGYEGEYTLSVVVAGQSRTSIHRPELCLPSQGKVFESAIKEILPGVPMVCGELRSKDAAHFSAGGFAYVYLNSKGATVSDLERVVGDTLARAWHHRIPRWAMLTVSSENVNFKTPEGEALLKEKMQRFYEMVREDI